MEPVEFLQQSLELRSHFSFFRGRSPCSGIRWDVANGAEVSEGQVLGVFLFTNDDPVPILCPMEAVVLRRYEPDGAALHQRPSQLVALLAPPRGRVDDARWRDLAPLEADSARLVLAGSPTAHVEDNRIIATWSFSVAPADFAVSITEVGDGGERAVPTLRPIALERRSTPTSDDWIATIELSASAEDRVFCLRTSAGHALDVGIPEPTHRRSPVLSRDAFDRLSELQALLDQQPDAGRALLSHMMPSADPDQLRADIDAEIEGMTPEVRAIWPFSALSKPRVDRAVLESFCDTAGIGRLTVDEVRNTDFQTKEDWQRYATAKGAAWFHVGGDVERPLSEELENPSSDMTYAVRAEDVVGGSLSMALFADNGTSLYASRGITNQIAGSGLPYAFHLGDVYYGGSEEEMANYFEAPLKPMFDRTELFMITGNHEMYAGGKWFKRMIHRKAVDHSARQRQRAESFRLCGDGFQIIGLDTMFVNWKGGRIRKDDYADDARLALLRGWLQERPNDLTILLTTNHAWDTGDKDPTRLYRSLRSTIAGRVDLWFWGNVHYAALFDQWPFNDAGSPSRNMVTSCIGHGGYPFYTQTSVGRLPAPLQCRWFETKSRFYPESRLRDDVGLNGWCKMTLEREPDGWGILLMYIDWMGRERCRARLGRKDGGGIYFKSVEESEIASAGAQPVWHARPLGSYP